LDIFALNCLAVTNLFNIRKEDAMRKLGLLFVGLALVCAVSSAWAQEAEKKKAKDLEAVISSVGQRTITFQYERKEKVREEVVGVDDQTNIDKEGTKIKLKDLQEGDKVMITYEPDAYTPAIAVKVVGKGEVKKVGGGE
jgi:hypothetical protein